MKPSTIVSRHILATALLLSPVIASASPPNQQPQGGGVIYPSWTGQYFDNAEMAGKPRWQQPEIRVRFDWDSTRPVVGTRSERMAGFPTDNFSARWNAQFIVRFDEPYTFHLLSDERARLLIRPVGTSEWRTLIDAWEPHPRRTDTGTLELKKGTTYDIQIDYADHTGDAVCELRWSSPSTPLEVVDYLASTTTHVSYNTPLANHYLNGKFDGERYEDAPDYTPTVFDGDIKDHDADGWPKQDFALTLAGGFAAYPGRYLVQFQGQAQVESNGNWVVGEESFPGTLPKGKGYNAATNTTRAYIDCKDERGLREFKLTNTQRNPSDPEGSGVSKIYVMLPRTLDSKESHSPGELANGEWIQAMLPYINFRFQGPGLSEVVKWEHRTPPTFSRWSSYRAKNDICIESAIQIANESGRDFWYNFGGSWDEEYMGKFALALRYGTDGREPYTKPTANPKYPPLNSNLRAYVEYGNEMGWSSIQPRNWANVDLKNHFDTQSPVWKALNFDGSLTAWNQGTYRYLGYRYARMSQALRTAFGDSAMGEQVRVVLFGQYSQAYQNTALQYIQDYFNNPQFNSQPRPVSDTIWGSGLAVYYGGENIWAEGDITWFKDRSFEAYPVNPGQALLAPQGGAWSFTGGAGVADFSGPKSPAFQPVPASPGPASAGRAVGLRFTVGAEDIYVSAFGLLNLTDKSPVGTIVLTQADGSTIKPGRTSVTFGGRGFKLSAAEKQPAAWIWRGTGTSGWATADSWRPATYRLEAGKSYLLLSTTQIGEKVPAPAPVVAAPGITIDGPVSAQINTQALSATEITSAGPVGSAFPHLSFQFASAVKLPGGIVLGLPDPRLGPEFPVGVTGKNPNPKEVLEGSKLAFIAGPGSISQKITINEPGEYTLVMTGNSQFGRENNLNIRIGENLVWQNISFGQGRKPDNGHYTYATEYVTLQPGTYEVVIEGLSKNPTDVVYINGLHLGSMKDYFGGPEAKNFLGAGSATGQTNSSFTQNIAHSSGMALNWGTVPVTYEGGNSVGGDWNTGGVLFWEQSKNHHTTTGVADHNAANGWFSFGGFNFTQYYPPFTWSDWPNAESYVQWQATKKRAETWKWEPTQGIALPATLTTALPHYTGSTGSTYNGYWNPVTNDKWTSAPSDLTQGMWKSWIIRSPRRADYSVTVTGTGAFDVLIDDRVVASTTTGTATAKVNLTQAMHSVKVRSTDASASVNTIEIR